MNNNGRTNRLETQYRVLCYCIGVPAYVYSTLAEAKRKAAALKADGATKVEIVRRRSLS